MLTRSRILLLAAHVLSAVFATMAFIGIVRSIYHPSPGLLLSILVACVAAVAFTVYAKKVGASPDDGS